MCCQVVVEGSSLNDHHPGAFFEESGHYAAPDTVPTAGDQRNIAL
jgi:hypothetical protein